MGLIWKVHGQSHMEFSSHLCLRWATHTINFNLYADDAELYLQAWYPETNWTTNMSWWHEDLNGRSFLLLSSDVTEMLSLDLRSSETGCHQFSYLPKAPHAAATTSFDSYCHLEDPLEAPIWSYLTLRTLTAFCLNYIESALLWIEAVQVKSYELNYDVSVRKYRICSVMIVEFNLNIRKKHVYYSYLIMF